MTRYRLAGALKVPEESRINSTQNSTEPSSIINDDLPAYRDDTETDDVELVIAPRCCRGLMAERQALVWAFLQIEASGRRKGPL